jgi:16S rRNA (guanine527-N7)-methyltransferase
MSGADRHGELAALLARYECPADASAPLAMLLDALSTPNAPTSVHDPAAGVNVHIADSLAGLEVADLRAAETIADLGAGAGLPGLVLASVLPRARVFLVESVRRKCEFLHATAATMSLSNAEVVCARAEEWRDGIARCDAVCARALAALPALCEYAAPLLCEGGVLVAWKGAVGPEELADASAASAHLGLALEPPLAVVPYTGSERRTLHVARKTAPTPAGYPRRPGIATKRPLTAKNLR